MVRGEKGSSVMSDAKKPTGYHILGLLDSHTRLVSDTHTFIIQKLRITKDKQAVWTSHYYYAEIGDAIRGYAKYSARVKGRKMPNTKPLLDLLDLVKNLELSIYKVGDRLSKEWSSISQDPISIAMFKDYPNGRESTDS